MRVITARRRRVHPIDMTLVLAIIILAVLAAIVGGCSLSWQPGGGFDLDVLPIEIKTLRPPAQHPATNVSKPAAATPN